MNTQTAQLIVAASAYDRGDARRIHHFLKVHDFAMTIAALEGVDARTAMVIETAAVLHDIGIHEAERKHGNGHGRFQELEGPAVARDIMARVGGYDAETVERVCWLIAHHHHYDHIEGTDYQILVEADFLVNAYEDGLSPHAVDTARARLFRTATGLKLLAALYPGGGEAKNEVVD